LTGFDIYVTMSNVYSIRLLSGYAIFHRDTSSAAS
jgi:hypothetical protein